MFNKKKSWFRFGKSIVNLNYVIRVFTDKDKPGLTVEYIGNSSCYYGFDTIKDRDEVFEKIMECINL